MSLATKYRPQTFEQLAGQSHVVETIQGMLRSGRINQTILVHGPWGSGKTSTARLLARYVNCSDKDRALEAPPCGKCESCLTGNEIEEINAASVGGIDTIRNIIQRASCRPPHGGRYHIYVLDEAHQLTKQAVQALLKIMEEPPKAAMFILCTTDPQRFPPALASRCLRLGIRPVDPLVTAKVLARVVEAEGLDRDIYTDKLLGNVALAVNGHPRDAITTLEAVIARIGSRPPEDVPNLEEYCTRVVEEEAGERPEAQVGRYLLALYRGKFTGAIQVLQQVQRHGDFIDHVVRFHTHTLYYALGKKLRQPDFSPWYQQVEKLWPDWRECPLDTLIDAMTLFCDTKRATGPYETNGFDELLAMTLGAVRKFR